MSLLSLAIVFFLLEAFWSCSLLHPLVHLVVSLVLSVSLDFLKIFPWLQLTLVAKHFVKILL